MIYKFKSAATGHLIMLGPHGNALLRLLGREPAAQGIIEVADLPAAIGQLSAAVAAAQEPPAAVAADGGEAEAGVIGLRQRLWPMIEMLRCCQAAQVPVVWGV